MNAETKGRYSIPLKGQYEATKDMKLKTKSILFFVLSLGVNSLGLYCKHNSIRR